MNTRTEILQKFFDLEIIKFGNFTLKSGIQSPFYVDLRTMTSSPVLLQQLAQELRSLCASQRYELICGVPYAALPLATVMSIQADTPLIIKRKESKGYGTNKLIEGIFQKGQKALIVEDVITSGKSLLETIPELEKEGLVVQDIVIVIDRQQGGKALLEQAGYRVHVLFTIQDVIDAFQLKGLINQNTKDKALQFLAKNTTTPTQPKRKSLAEKRNLVHHPTARKLIDIALRKKTNLIGSADVTTKADLLTLTQKIAPYIAALKIHADIIIDFDEDLVAQLRDLAKAHDFLIFEDRKFADIGNTAVLQMTRGLHRISDWASMVTAHVTAGEGSIVALKNAAPHIAIIPIIQMSTQDTLTDHHYCKKAMQVIQKHPDAVIGVVAQSHPAPDELLKFTPGINLDVKGDSKGQSYHSPKVAFEKYKTDFIIVGRGIYQAAAPEAAAKRYAKIAWEAQKIK